MDFIKEEDFKNTKNRVLSERKFDIHMSFSYFNCLTQMALQPKNAEFANNKELYFFCGNFLSNTYLFTF